MERKRVETNRIRFSGRRVNRTPRFIPFFKEELLHGRGEREKGLGKEKEVEKGIERGESGQKKQRKGTSSGESKCSERNPRNFSDRCRFRKKTIRSI